VFYNHAAFYLYATVLAPFLLCSCFYGLRSPWRSSRTGRAVFTLLASMTAVLVFAVVVQIAEIPRDVRDALRFVTLLPVAAAGWFLFFDIVRLQRQVRRCRPLDQKET
jgi:chromate transport protein ChrA